MDLRPSQNLKKESFREWCSIIPVDLRKRHRHK